MGVKVGDQQFVQRVGHLDAFAVDLIEAEVYIRHVMVVVKDAVGVHM